MTIDKQFDILYPILNGISPLSTDNWEIAKKYFKTTTLSKGEHLFYMEDDVKDFYFLIDGLARYYYLTEDGKEFNKSFAEKQGHLLSSISSVSHGTGSPFSVEVLSSFITLHIPYKKLLELGFEHRQWNDLLLRIYENLVIKKEKREADFLLLSARKRYEKFLEDYSMIEDAVPNYHIASYLGITDVALSRIRKEMKN
ncbi:putative transcriptional regulator, Crp/Fnr family [Arcobacter nitrofigilis DSM 7299]|uniref:Putative transcriptional regulator, Crp/Fnr family n=1 Tax=Arcobacter nitrofigilis (strain ATCC 33309 / DSM 7299 / CCUG 15893 / LMG 7604 / NCTC 12251 / CI) TaxID=572480 RepID=D5UZS9_ARCNC|nr:Crp/Fnr family transcriptional regulator [Arcobacter nitrofigilis]ADG93298.1 putative transcriptional regulator, Crp/Fnr family [Arcobacter nitrofigilis DSM 7299]